MVDLPRVVLVSGIQESDSAFFNAVFSYAYTYIHSLSDSLPI